MNFKKITAAVMAVTALAAMPCLPESIKPIYDCITSAAASTNGTVTVNNVHYTIYTENSTQYAVADYLTNNLTSLTIPATVSFNNKNVPVTKITSIRDSVKSLRFECSSITIPANTFQGNRGLQTVTFASSVKNITINSGAFYGMPSLQSVSFDNSTAKVVLGKEAFADSTLRNLKMPRTLNLSTIPEGCFMYCSNLSYTQLQIPDAVTRIEKNAFRDAVLSSVVAIGKNISYVDPSAFAYVDGVSRFSVDSNCKALKVVSDALYSADGKTLYCYPQKKVASSFTCTATTIADGVIHDNTSLRTLNISSYVRRSGDTADFADLKNLEILTVSSSEFQHTITENNKKKYDVMGRFKSLFVGTKLHKVNGEEVLVIPSNNEPTFNTHFLDYTKDHFEIFANSQFMIDYTNVMAQYVASKVTNSGMSDLEKAVKLHKWILDRVTYDPDFENGLADRKTQVPASVFLYNKGGQGYTVCMGYAHCYTLLLKAAGIEAYTVGGTKYGYDIVGHAWNKIKLGGNWYNVDCCWDDGIYDKSQLNRDYASYFKYFLCTDSTFAQDGHQAYACSHLDSEYNNNAVPSATTSIGGLGNADMAGSCDANDLNAIRSLIGITVNSSNIRQINADLNMDGKITYDDYDLMYGYLYRNPMKFSVKTWVMKNFES